MALQIFGVIRLQPKFRTLTKCHTEKRRVRRVIKTRHWQSRRRRWCVERRRQFANSISTLYIKRLPQQSYQESVRYASVALYAVGTSVTLRLSPSSPSLRVPYYVRVLVCHVIFRKHHNLCDKSFLSKGYIPLCCFLYQPVRTPCNLLAMSKVQNSKFSSEGIGK